MTNRPLMKLVPLRGMRKFIHKFRRFSRRTCLRLRRGIVRRGIRAPSGTPRVQSDSRKRHLDYPAPGIA